MQRLFKCLLILFFWLPTGAALADIDGARAAYESGDYARAITLARAAEDAAETEADALAARLIRALSEGDMGRSGTVYLAELQALDDDMQRLGWDDPVQTYNLLATTGYVQYQLGLTKDFAGTYVRLALLSLQLGDPPEEYLSLLADITTAYSEGTAPRDALYYSALYAFWAEELMGTDALETRSAQAELALALVAADEPLRAVAIYTDHAPDDWAAYSDSDPHLAFVYDEMRRVIGPLIRPDDANWIAALDAEIARRETQAKLVEEIGTFMGSKAEAGPVRALIAQYLAIATPDDPLAARFLALELDAVLTTGNLDAARTYLAALLDYPVPFSALNDLPLRQMAGALSFVGVADDAILGPLIRRAVEIERLVPGDDPELLFDLSRDLGLMHARRGETEAAIAAFDAALALPRGPQDQRFRNHGPTLHLLGEMQSYAARHTAAVETYTRLTEVARVRDDGPGLRAGIMGVAQSHLGAGDTAKALEFAKARVALDEAAGLAGTEDSIPGLTMLAIAHFIQAERQAGALSETITALMAVPTDHADFNEMRDNVAVLFASEIDATPQTIAVHPAFQSATDQQRATMATILCDMAIERGDYAEAFEWLDVAFAQAGEGTPEQRKLLELGAYLSLVLDDAQTALGLARRLTDALLDARAAEHEIETTHLPLHLAALQAMLQDPATEDAGRISAEMFTVAQMASDTTVRGALGQAVVRMQSGEAGAGLLRDRAALDREIKEVEDQIARLAFEGRSTAEPVARLNDLSQRHAALTARLREEVPALARPEFADLRQLQDVAARLREDEVLALYATSNRELPDGSFASYLVAIDQHDIKVAQLPARAELVRLGLELRCAATGGDPACVAARVGTTRSTFGTSMALAAQPEEPDFDTDLAHRVYQAVLAPAGGMLEGSRRLIVVPDAALVAMPFQLTIRTPALPGGSLRNADWLMRHMSVEVAPSVAGFLASRQRARTDRTTSRFLGIGDPLIGAQRRGAQPYDCGGPGDLILASADRSGLNSSDPETRMRLVVDLDALPEARCELRSIADRFPDSTLLLQGEATETAIKTLNSTGALRDYAVLSFATHGLVAGEIGVNEAGLVLSPPRLATAEDDGLLSTTEIAGLDLAADFVILSACNTASGDSRNSQALSGMAAAFFSAGAETLLVSHWPVVSDAAVRLTTDTFDRLRGDPEMPRAEALRASMMAILDDPEAPPHHAHPAYWAPFMIVGDGLGVSR